MDRRQAVALDRYLTTPPEDDPEPAVFSPADIDAILSGLAQVEEELSAANERRANLREALAEALAATDGPLVRPLATVRMTASSERVTYDARRLDGLCADDEAIAEVLRPFRNATVVAGSLRVEWAKGGDA